MSATTKGKLSKITLGTIGNGVAGELFEREMKFVLENIQDITTPWKQARKIRLEFIIRPQEDRLSADVEIECSKKIPTCRPLNTEIFIEDNDGDLFAVQEDPRQGILNLKPRRVKNGVFAPELN